MKQKTDVKNAFQQVRVDPAGVVKFGYVPEDYLFIYMPLQF